MTEPVEKAYCCTRAHCAFDGLGDRAAAAQAWRSAIELDPASAVARAGLGMTTTNATERAEALKEAQALQPRDARTALIRAASSDNDAEQLEILDGLLASSSETRCLAESLLWLHEHDFDSSKALEPTRSILEQAAQFAIDTFGDDEENICAEFGTYHGRSLRVLDQRLPHNWQLHGFDSFVGLPEQWRHEPAGSTYGRPRLGGGLLPGARGAPRGLVQRDGGALAKRCGRRRRVGVTPRRLRLVLVGARLPAGWRPCSTGLGHSLRRLPRARTWRDDEKRAWDEAIAENGLEVEVVAASLLSSGALACG